MIIQDCYIGLIFGFMVYSVSGTAITTLSCKENGEEGKAHTITCDTQGNITSGITFTRPDYIAVGQCNFTRYCVPNNAYNVTNSGNKYELHIQNLRKEDAGNWKCRDGANGIMKMGCNLTISSPVSAPVTNGVSLPTGIVHVAVVATLIIYTCLGKRWTNGK